MNEQPNFTPTPYIPKEKIVFHSTGRDLLFAGLFLVCAFLWMAWGLWGGWQLGFSIAFVVLFIVATAYLCKKGRKVSGYSIVCGAFSLLMTSVFFMTSNNTVRVLSILIQILLFWIYLAGLAGKGIPKGDLGLFSVWFGGFGNAFTHLVPVLKSLFQTEDEKKKHAMRGVIGALCAIPVLAVVIPLLIRSDAAFESMVSGLFRNISSLIGQIIATAVFAPFLISYLVSMHKHEKPFKQAKNPKGLESVFWISFLTVLSICYGAYLFSQLAYFFSAFSGILPEGYVFSYAEYARRGFFELCGIAGINLVLILFMLLFSKKKDGKLSGVLRAFGTFIGLFTLLLIATAISKMVMYIGKFGMTILRLGTSAFMIFMAVVFFAAILRCYTDKVKVLQVSVITASVVLIALGVCNINTVVAKYNYEAYRSGKLASIDVEYLSTIGEEATPYILRLCKDAPTEKNLQALETIFNQEYGFDYIIEEGDTAEYYIPTERWYVGFTQYSIPRGRSYALLDGYQKDHPNFFKERSVAATEY